MEVQIKRRKSKTMEGNGYIDGMDFHIFVADARKKEHVHRELEILYSIEGEIVVTVDDARYTLKKDDILLINGGRRHSVHRPVGRGKDVIVSCIHISERMLSEYTGQYHLFFWCNTMQDNEKSGYQELRKILNNLMIDYMNGKKEKYFWRYSQCYQLLHMLVTYFLVSQEDMGVGTMSGEKDSERYQEIMHYIELYYDRDISLNELAEKFHLSVSYLSKYLKKNLGMNFTDYLYSVRLRHAVEDLLDSDKPVTRLALDHGYPSVSVFNKQFKEKYQCTPSEYRAEMKKSILGVEVRKEQWELNLIRERLLEHFGISQQEDKVEESDSALKIEADAVVSVPYEPVWNKAINVGSAETLLYSDMRDALLYANKYLKYQYVRIWSIFSNEFYIVRNGEWSTSGFQKLNQVLRFLVENQMKPIIELGEKPNRILIGPGEFIKEPDNRSEFTSYNQFLGCLDALMQNFVSYFGKAEVESWLIEIWDDKRTEVYVDKVPYMQLFRDCNRIIKKSAPGILVGGAGNFLGWYHEHTEESVRKWIDNGVYPDYLTYTYYPYAAGDQYSESFSKRKSDESDVSHSLDSLNQLLFHYGYPRREVYITDWNMSMSSRNYFHDSLWKGCYVLKCNLEAIGKTKALVYGQLVDSTSDYYDSCNIINGAGGLLTRDLIDKPAFIAMRMLEELQDRIVEKGDGYIITENEEQEFSIIVYNFINRNYLYYIKGENENQIEDHYRYLEHQEGKKVELTLKNLPSDTRYDIRQYITNRDQGSIMDEWVALSCMKSPNAEDITYLKRMATPKIRFEVRTVEDGCISMECHLKPLEMRLITLKKSRN